MKRLYLLRHAKSDWNHPDLPDDERGLSPRGRQAAAAMGRYMRREGLTPALAVSSTARRALETWELLAPELKAEIPLETSTKLYLATPARLLKTVHGLADKWPSAFLLGHNPGIQAFALELVGGGRSPPRARLASKYPTAALAVFDFEISHWSDLAGGMGVLERFIVPRDLD